MYYIYHIPGIKIGCTTQYPKRCIDQGYTNYELLETYEDGWLAGDREQELQKEYGLPIDTSHYMISRENRRRGAVIGGNVAKRSGQLAEAAKKGSSAGGKGKRYLNFQIAEEIREKWTGKRGEQKKLAREYNVHRGVIYDIVNNKSYLEP